MITFKTLRWKNFLSTGAHFTEINFTKSNNTLIIADAEMDEVGDGGYKYIFEYFAPNKNYQIRINNK